MEAGVIAVENDAYTDAFIGDGGRAYVEKHALAPVDALAVIHKAGGVCVIAHPGMWRGNDPVPDELIEKMATGGMDGIEVDHPDHTLEQRAHYRELARRMNLVPTGSTDYHGERSPGVWPGQETTRREAFEELRSRAARRKVRS